MGSISIRIFIMCRGKKVLIPKSRPVFAEEYHVRMFQRKPYLDLISCIEKLSYVWISAVGVSKGTPQGIDRRKSSGIFFFAPLPKILP